MLAEALEIMEEVRPPKTLEEKVRWLERQLRGLPTETRENVLSLHKDGEDAFDWLSFALSIVYKPTQHSPRLLFKNKAKSSVPIVSFPFDLVHLSRAAFDHDKDGQIIFDTEVKLENMKEVITLREHLRVQKWDPQNSVMILSIPYLFQMLDLWNISWNGKNYNAHKMLTILVSHLKRLHRSDLLELAAYLKEIKNPPAPIRSSVSIPVQQPIHVQPAPSVLVQPAPPIIIQPLPVPVDQAPPVQQKKPVPEEQKQPEPGPSPQRAKRLKQKHVSFYLPELDPRMTVKPLKSAKGPLDLDFGGPAKKPSSGSGEKQVIDLAFGEQESGSSSQDESRKRDEDPTQAATLFALKMIQMAMTERDRQDSTKGRSIRSAISKMCEVATDKDHQRILRRIKSIIDSKDDQNNVEEDDNRAIFKRRIEYEDSETEDEIQRHKEDPKPVAPTIETAPKEKQDAVVNNAKEPQVVMEQSLREDREIIKVIQSSMAPTGNKISSLRVKFKRTKGHKPELDRLGKFYSTQRNLSSRRNTTKQRRPDVENRNL